MTRSTRGATHVAAENNGSLRPARRFSETPPPPRQWAECISVLVTGLAAIGRLGGEAGSTAVSTLSRAAEAVPSIMADPAVRAAIAVGSSLAEARSPAPAPTPAPVVDRDLLDELRLVRSAITELQSTPAPAHLAPQPTAPTLPSLASSTPPVCDEAYFERRIIELEAKRKWAQQRGDRLNARTASTQLTSARKRLRQLQELRKAEGK